MKRYVFAGLLTSVAAPAIATPVPGTWDVGQQPISYPVIGADGNYNEVNGDGTNAHGGVPPYFAIQPSNISSTVTNQITTNDAVVTGSASGTTLTITGVTSGTVVPGVQVHVLTNNYGNYPSITAQLTGTTGSACPTNCNGTTGTYGLSASLSLSSQTLNLNSGNTTGSDELKFRFTQYGIKADAFDMIKGHCIRSYGHLHEFIGPMVLGACSTYTQIRTDGIAMRNSGKPASSNQGDDLNLSAYWHMALIDPQALAGTSQIKIEAYTPLYYQIPNGSCGSNNSCLITNISPRYVDLGLQLNYISGRSFSDPFNLKLQNAVNVANAANSSTATANGYGYSILGGMADGTGTTWYCIQQGTGSVTSQADNLADVTCNAGDNVALEMHGKGCWDGKNGSSPSGEDNVFPVVHVHAANGDWDDVCPKNWYHIPFLIDKTEWTLYKNISSSIAGDEPYLSSDAAFQAAARAQAGVCVGSGATQACAPGNASTYVCKSACSGHFDYVVAWDKKFLRRAFRKCLAIPQTDPSETGVDADQTVRGTACNSGTMSIDAGTASILGTSNQVGFGRDVTGNRVNQYWPTPDAHSGTTH